MRRKYRVLAPSLSERSRRLWAATEAQALGYGGIAGVARVTNISRSTIVRGLRELANSRALPAGRVRRPGGGRKRTIAVDRTLPADLEALVAPTIAGDPQSPLRWTSKSLRRLATELQARGHRISHTLVGELLRAAGYRLRAARKAQEGEQHPDRDGQFRYLSDQIRRAQRRGQPVISVDTKKKELVGDFKTPGREWRATGAAPRVRVHDFPSQARGKAIPYGVYDVTRNEGWVSVGVTHDTARFAVNAIRQWWQRLGRRAYPAARSLVITADAGGSNGPRVRLWKWDLQRFADQTGLTITVCHFPPGTSKWNRVEHRLFSFISVNWRGKPLVDYVTVVELIGATTTAAGLQVRAALDRRRYPEGIQISDAQLAQVQLTPHAFHGDWNYTIRPRRR